MTDKVKYTFEKERSNEVELVASNLEAILKSSTYKLAHEDIDLLNTDEMRGVRMLLEITKPEQILEKEKIISTVIVFGGVHISDCLLYTSPSPRDKRQSRMPSSA